MHVSSYYFENGFLVAFKLNLDLEKLYKKSPKFRFEVFQVNVNSLH